MFGGCRGRGRTGSDRREEAAPGSGRRLRADPSFTRPSLGQGLEEGLGHHRVAIGGRVNVPFQAHVREGRGSGSDPYCLTAPNVSPVTM